MEVLLRELAPMPAANLFSTEAQSDPCTPVHRARFQPSGGASMSDQVDSNQDALELAAAQLVAIVKRTLSNDADFKMPILDESSVWIVSVKRLGIREEMVNIDHA